MTCPQDSGTTSSGLAEMHLPDTFSGHRCPVSNNQLFLDTSRDIRCEQVMDFPTRTDNTLCIFGTNKPSLIERCFSLHGISNHDVVLVDSCVLPTHKKPVKRKVYLWKRTNKQAMEEDGQFTEQFTKDTSTSTL